MSWADDSLAPCMLPSTYCPFKRMPLSSTSESERRDPVTNCALKPHTHIPQEPTAPGLVQEYFLEDVVDILEWVAQAMPNAMESLPSNEFVNLVIVFLGSPAYIKNAHLRAKLVDVSARFALLRETIFRDVSAFLAPAERRSACRSMSA